MRFFSPSDTRTATGRVRPRDAQPRHGTWRRPLGWPGVLAVAVLMFVGGFSSVVVTAVWQYRGQPERVCEQNLRRLYVAYRKLPLRYRQRPCPIEAVAVVLGQPFLLTADDFRYLDPTIKNPPIMAYGGPELEVLVCMKDPLWVQKIAPTAARAFTLAPSYDWCPDAKTLAYCPFHHFALRWDGRIERRPAR